jgi:hypothetical protein
MNLCVGLCLLCEFSIDLIVSCVMFVFHVIQVRVFLTFNSGCGWPRCAIWFLYSSSSFKFSFTHSILMPVYLEVQFGHIFRFLLSAGPSYSALPVNAKEYSGVFCFRQKLLFIDVLIFNSWIPMWYLFLSDSGCTCWVFLHPCAYLVFRYQMFATCMGIRSSTIITSKYI